MNSRYKQVIDAIGEDDREVTEILGALLRAGHRWSIGELHTALHKMCDLGYLGGCENPETYIDEYWVCLTKEELAELQ